MDKHTYCMGCGIHSIHCGCWQQMADAGMVGWTVFRVVCDATHPGRRDLGTAEQALAGPISTRVEKSIAVQKFRHGVIEPLVQEKRNARDGEDQETAAA